MKKLYLISAAYVDEMAALEKHIASSISDKQLYAAYADSQDDEDSKPYQVINGIALYSIKGKILSTGNWLTELFGIPTYDAISDTLSQIAQDENVRETLVAMDTPGGVVSGISDVSEAWRRVNAIKPITVHAGGGIGSAGVWLASNSSAIYASETAEYGSIGVRTQHVSQEKALLREGLKVTDISSSPLKAAGSPAKDLSPEDLAYLQRKVDETDQLFRAQMYKTRPGISAEAFTGEMFSASNAVKLGLIDGINTYSGVFEQLSASAGSHKSTSYTEDPSMKKRYVTAAMASAAIESGADPKSMEIISDEKYAALPDKDKELATEADVPPVEPEALSAEVQELMVQTATLTEELASALMQVDQLTAQVADLTAKVEAQATDPLRVIAEERVRTMRTALGLVSIEMSDFSTTSLLAEHAALTTQFKKAYTPGGHVKPTAPAEPVVKKATVTSIESARLRATGI